jgi:membrane fusion protein, multidrug efflux system
MSVASENMVEREAVPVDTREVRAKRRFRIRASWLRYPLMAIVPLALVVVGGRYFIMSERYASTDDAYVQADKVALSADVGGRVLAVEVRNNQDVTAGQVLFRLDDRPYKIALERAEAMLASARMQVDGLRASYRQRQADVKAAQDTLAFAQREFDRQRELLANHVTPQSRFDEARHALDAARQQLAAAEQQRASVLASLDGDPEIPTERHPLVMQAQAQVDQAKLDLSHTVVYAPADGVVSRVDQLPVGTYLNAATPAFALVSTQHAWVEANFKETDLEHMQPGQQATVDIDTYSDRSCTGTVDSLAAATGAEFSVLPPQNATGNWVKVVQRIPVRIAVDCGPGRPLRSGMSATVEVDTHFERPWVKRLNAILASLFGGRSAAAADRS